MNTRTTLFLVVLVAVVGGFVLWDHYKGTTTEQRVSKSKRLVEFDPKDITGIDLIRSNQTIVLEKSGELWDLKQPLLARADAGAVNAILDELEFAERTRTIAGKELDGVSLADFGLDAPAIRVTLHSKKRPLALLVGRETPTKDALYVQVEGRKEVLVARKSIADRLGQSVESLRSRTAVEFTPSAVTRLEVKVGDRVIELSRAPTVTNVVSRWTLTRPLIARADQDKVSELLSDLEGLRIQDFVSEDPKDVHTYALDEPEREVTVFSGDTGKTLVLGQPLTNDASKVYAKLKASPSIFTVSADAAKKFNTQINDLRDRRVLVFDDEAVTGIEILRGTDAIQLRSGTNGWTLTAPVALAADDGAVRQFLRDLGELRATEFVADVAHDLDRYGLAVPAVTVSLLSGETNVLAQLLVGGLDAGSAIRFVKRADEPFVYGVETNALGRVPGQYGVFRARQVFDLKPDQVTKLQSGSVTVARDPDGKWKLVEPAQGVLDADKLQHVLAAFCQLHAESFGTGKTESLTGTKLQAGIGDTTHWLVVTPDGQAEADVCELSFRLDPPVVQTLTNTFVTTAPATNAPAAAK
jgi:hypothetical protein